MYAILIEDEVTEKRSILSVLAADEVAAMILMLTHAEAWCTKQDVNLGYTIHQHDYLQQVTVLCGIRVVLSITVQSIEGLVSSTELMSFISPKPSDIN